MKSCLRHWGAVLFTGLSALFGATAAWPQDGAPGADRNREYAVKAAYLYHLTQFVTWPSGEDRDEFFDVWILGRDPFGPLLEQAVSAKTALGRSYAVHRASSATAVPRGSDLDVVFLGVDDLETAQQWTADLGRGPILVVSDVPDHAATNGVIGFYIEGRNVRFEINRKNALERGLRISSQVLDLARIVGEER